MEPSAKTRVAIVGAGPAGLTAAYLLSKEKVPVIVLEADPLYVGGIARTVDYKGFRFDIGGHRFFSKSKEVEDLWQEILPNDLLERPRSSRIYYRGRFYSYPIKAAETLVKLGPLEAGLCVLSYSRARLFPHPAPKNVEEWVTNQFGERLYKTFFKTYTEKVWGMSCKEISADWAAQRIKGLSLETAIKNALLSKAKRRTPKNRRDIVKTLIESFRYPRKGPGMLWEACAASVRAMGGRVEMGQTVEACTFDAERKVWRVDSRGQDGAPFTVEAEHVISSAPLGALPRSIAPKLSDAATKAAAALKYRDFLTVMLILKDRAQFSDNWIYIHDPGVRVGRIQNFKSWSPEMVPDPAYVSYGLEYFCFEGDSLWSSPDEALIALAKKEIETLGLARAADITDGCVVRQPKAYPVYDDDYAGNVELLRDEMERTYPTFHTVGRNGMHKYNNQDHAMMTAMLTVKNILAGRRVYDIWQVNQDAEYHEETKISAGGLRDVPRRVSG